MDNPYDQKLTRPAPPASANKLDLLQKISGSRWNEEFQSLLEAADQDRANSAVAIERTNKLRKLCEDFATAAKQHAITIVSEMFCDKKTIPPLTQSLGGIAGGEKYITDGIFFKVAVDKNGLYGGDEGIMKAAGHELRGQMSYIDCRIKGLYFPLMVLVDYRGYRLLAQSVVPIGPDTLVYGSDSGLDILAENPEMNARMEAAGQILNLRPDWVYDSKQRRTLVHGPLDIEGHYAKDGRFYVLDTARVSPPVTPHRTIRGGFLYRLLRPEFVKANTVPLSSNAFSNWRMDDADEADDQVREATRKLEDEIVPKFAKVLDQEFGRVSTLQPMRKELARIVTETHRRGVNIRLLGLVRQKTTTARKLLRTVLLTEMMARTLKNNLRGKMRLLTTSDDTAFRELVVGYFNLVFGLEPQSRMYWQVDLKENVQKRFESALTSEEASINFDLRSSVSMLLLFHRLQDITGIRFKSDTETKIYGPQMQDVSQWDPLTNDDLLDICAVVKYIHRISFEEGTALAQQAIHTGAAELFRLADAKYEDSLQIKPDDYRALHNWGLSLMLQAMQTKQKDEMDNLFKLAAEKFSAAISINPRDSRAFFLWGNMLSEQARLKHGKESTNLLIAACAKYQKAYNVDKTNFDLLYNWGHALLSRAKLEEAAASESFHQAACKFEEATALKPTSPKCLRNWGVALAKLARTKHGRDAEVLFNLACQKCQECVKIKPTDHEAFFNWGNTLYRHAQLQAKEGNHQLAFELMDAACLRYLEVLDVNCANAGAVHNWGMVLQAQGNLLSKVSTVRHLHSGEEISASDAMIQAVECYLEVFGPFIRKYPANVTLKTLLTLAEVNEYFKIRATEILRQLAEPAVGSVQIALQSSASRALEIVKEYVPPPLTASQEKLRGIGRASARVLRVKERLLADDTTSLSISDFEMVAIVGKNTSNVERVFCVKRVGTQRHFNMKTFTREKIMERMKDPLLDSFAIDRILKNLQHPFVTSFKYIFQTDASVFVIYDEMSCTDLMRYASDGRFAEEVLRFYMAEICLALEYFHSIDFVYSYLKPEELVIDAQGHIELSEFAFFKASPSAIASDWVQLGRTLVSLLSGVHSKDAKPASLPPISAAAVDLSRKMITQQLKSAAEIRAHVWFSGIDWTDLKAKRSAPPIRPVPAVRDDLVLFGLGEGETAAPTLVATLKKSRFHGYTFVNVNANSAPSSPTSRSAAAVSASVLDRSASPTQTRLSSAASNNSTSSSTSPSSSSSLNGGGHATADSISKSNGTGYSINL